MSLSYVTGDEDEDEGWMLTCNDDGWGLVCVGIMGDSCLLLNYNYCTISSLLFVIYNMLFLVEIVLAWSWEI